MGTRILFIDRDGTLIEEPADQQIDRYEKLRLVPGAIPALLKLREAGFEFVMVTNQDGLGTASFPREDFQGPQALLMQILESQGVGFREVLVDESFEHENRPTRKPGVGLLLHYLRDRGIDLANSAVIGDRDTDLQLADNLGCRGFKLAPGPWTWAAIAEELTGTGRRAVVERSTRETRIRVAVDLDRVATTRSRTGLGFFDHMLEQIGKHAGIALEVDCEGDLEVDEHHTVEDTALALGEALKRALGDKSGIGRYGSAADDGQAGSDGLQARFVLPMDETLASAAVDFSGRPYFVFEGAFPREQVGGLPTELVPHFFRSLCETAGLNLHLQVRGENAHHMVEACFKATARAMRAALARSGSDLPSTKGSL